MVGQDRKGAFGSRKRKHCIENGQMCKKAKQIIAEEFPKQVQPEVLDTACEHGKIDSSTTVTETISFEDFLSEQSGKNNAVLGVSSHRNKVQHTGLSKETTKRSSKRKKMKGSVDSNTLRNCELATQPMNLQIKSRKSSADDDVICLNAIDPHSKRIEKKPQNTINNLSSLQNECVLWTEKFSPQTSQSIMGKTSSVNRLISWLQAWKIKVEKKNELQLVESEKLQNTGEEDCSSLKDFKNGSDDEWCTDEDGDSLISTAVIFGPTGCGKTAAVYACARELNFEVFEMNSSSQRSSKQVFSQLQEATQSHQVSKSTKSVHNIESKCFPNAFVKFKKKGTKRKEESTDSLEHNNRDTPPTDSSSSQTSLILFDEVDVLFESDKFFWSAVQNLMSETKRPIIMTTTDNNVLNSLEGKYERFHFKHPSEGQFSSCMKKIGANASLEFSDEKDLLLAAEIYNHDIRKCIHALHFWGCHSSDQMSHFAMTENGRNNEPSMHLSLEKEPELIAERVCGRASETIRNCESSAHSNNRSQTVLEKSQENNVIVGFFDSICGIKDIVTPNLDPGKAISRKSDVLDDSNATMLSLLKALFLEPDNTTLYAKLENALSSMYWFNLPQIIFLNFYNLLLRKTLPRPLSVALPIHIPSSCFATPSHTTESTIGGLQNDYFSLVNGVQDSPLLPSSDYLTEENSSDDCGTRSFMEFSKKSVANNVWNNSTAYKLKDLLLLSVLSDTRSSSDLLHSRYLKISAGDGMSNPDESVCTCRDGLLDTFDKRIAEPSYKLKSTLSDVQASTQTLLLKHSLSRLGERDKCYPTDIVVETKEPHENGMRRRNQNQRYSVQSMLHGGNLSSRRSFILDYMPALRCICRVEERRKEAKTKRRFLHYLQNVNPYLKSSDIQRLQNEFEERPL